MQLLSRQSIVKYVLVLILTSGFIHAAATVEWGMLRKFSNPARPPAELSKLNGKKIEIRGFMVPIDGDMYGVTEFLLVPSAGMCIHVPPPPPNQMVYVRMVKGKAAEHTWEPIKVKGKFTLKQVNNDFGTAMFEIIANAVK